MGGWGYTEDSANVLLRLILAHVPWLAAHILFTNQKPAFGSSLVSESRFNSATVTIHFYSFFLYLDNLFGVVRIRFLGTSHESI